MACVRSFALARRAGQHMADDWDEEAERLSGARAGGHHEALSVRGESDRLLLVLLKRQRLVVGAKYDSAQNGIEDSVCNKGADIR